VTNDDTVHRAIRSTFLTHHGIHLSAVVPRAHLRGFVVPTDPIDAIHHPTYPSAVLGAFLMYTIRTTLLNVERWTTIATSLRSVGALSAQTHIPHWKRPQRRRHLGPREPWMTSVVCQASPISISFSLSSHSSASGISRTAPKGTLASTKSSLQRSI
jgi:hypothetical protein